MGHEEKLYRNIGTLYTMQPWEGDLLGRIDDAAMLVENGVVSWCGKEEEAPVDHTAQIEDLNQACVLPGLIDCHTHVVFAGDRADEFAMRAKGASYAEIMAAGGGIVKTMTATRNASKAELIDLALPRLERMRKRGVTLIDGKTGYGLCLQDELKQLEVMAELNRLQPIEIIPTFLGAHAVPPEYVGQKDAYVQHLIADILPEVAAQGIAKAVDMFVEKGAFSVQDAQAIAEVARGYGLGIRLHAEQLSHSGGARLAAKIGALSASHLEHASDEDIELLARANVVAELLPIAQEFLGMKQLMPARKMADAGVKVAVATDFNPGSAMCDDLHLAMRLAVTRCGLSCEEALLGVTRYAAQALGREDVGVLQKGAKANMCILDVKDANMLLYDWSVNPVRILG